MANLLILLGWLALTFCESGGIVYRVHLYDRCARTESRYPRASRLDQVLTGAMVLWSIYMVMTDRPMLIPWVALTLVCFMHFMLIVPEDSLKGINS